MAGLVLREDRDGLATLTLNRPEKLNSLNVEMFVELRGHVDQSRGTFHVHAVLLSTAPGYCLFAFVASSVVFSAIRKIAATSSNETRNKITNRMNNMGDPISTPATPSRKPWVNPIAPTIRATIAKKIQPPMYHNLMSFSVRNSVKEVSRRIAKTPRV